MITRLMISDYIILVVWNYNLMLFHGRFVLRLSPCLRYVGAPSEDGSVCAPGLKLASSGAGCYQEAYNAHRNIILLYLLKAVYCLTYFTWYKHLKYVLSIPAFMYIYIHIFNIIFFSFFIFLLVPNSNEAGAAGRDPGL